MGRIVNKRELSEILEVSERSLTEWQEEEPPLPMLRRGDRRGESNEYDTAAAIRWYADRQLRKAQVESPADRLNRLRGDREELELKKLRGALVPPEELRPALEQYVSDCLAALEGLPEKYTETLLLIDDADGMHQALVEIVRDIREQLGAYTWAVRRIDGAAAAGGDQPLPSAA